jgi:hypothetical protein
MRLVNQFQVDSRLVSDSVFGRVRPEPFRKQAGWGPTPSGHSYRCNDDPERFSDSPCPVTLVV